MALLNSTLNSRFDVSRILKEHATDTRQLISKDIVNIRLSETLGEGDIGIGYAYIPIKDIEDSLSIIDRSHSMRENVLTESISALDIRFTGPNYDNIVSSYFLITDQFTVATTTDPSVALYYAHDVPATMGIRSVVDCEIVDKNYEPVNTRLYTKDLANGAIYTNLTNSYDETLCTLNVYYARYMLDNSSNVDVMLNVSPVYNEADFSDIDQFGNLKTDVKRYILNYNSDAGGYALVTPKTIEYSIKYEARASISILSPKANILDRIWFLRINNGSFIRQYGADLYKYDIKEFGEQLFNPYQPYKFAIDQRCEILEDGIVKLPDDNIKVYVGESLHINVIIKDKEDNVLYASSTVPSRDGDPFIDSDGVHDINWDSSLIHSYDEKGGFVKLNAQLKFSYNVYMSYYYTEDKYEMSDLNINPISNINAGDYKYVFYIVPGGPSNTSREKSIYYLQVDDSGLIVYCSQRGGDGNVDLATTIEGILDYDKGASNFIESYTTAGADSQATHYLLVGEVSMVDLYRSGDLSVIDIRLRGGGLREDYDVDANIDVSPEIKWFEDIGFWDGQPHSGNTILIVRLPYSILKDYGGIFEKNEVEAIVNKHMALGTYAAIRYYGNVAQISSFIPGDTVINMIWDNVGSGFTYDVYVGFGLDGDFSKHNVSPISGTTYTVDLLVNNRVHYVYIVASKDGTSYHKSEIWSAIPFV